MSIEEKVKEVIVEQMGVSEEEVVPGADLVNDLLADSLDVVVLTMAIEEEFCIAISDEKAEKLVTVQDVVDIVTELKGE
jgi:acyl carrier protein